jgi:formylglycine-generating enzyme required for sulfatase activity
MMYHTQKEVLEMKWKACLVFACLLIGAIPVAFGPSTPTPSAGDIWTRPADGAVMVYVPAGEFLMGSSDYPYAAPDEKPQHTV